MGEILDRIRNAISFLKDKKSFKVGDLYFGIDKEDYLNVTGVSNYLSLENITKKVALQELKEIKQLFDKMVNYSLELKNFTVTRKIKFNLNYDYGMGSIRVCSEQERVVTWEADIKDE